MAKQQKSAVKKMKSMFDFRDNKTVTVLVGDGVKVVFKKSMLWEEGTRGQVKWSVIRTHIYRKIEDRWVKVLQLKAGSKDNNAWMGEEDLIQDTVESQTISA
jgi:hypothetical protein